MHMVCVSHSCRAISSSIIKVCFSIWGVLEEEMRVWGTAPLRVIGCDGHASIYRAGVWVMCVREVFGWGDCLGLYYPQHTRDTARAMRPSLLDLQPPVTSRTFDLTVPFSFLEICIIKLLWHSFTLHLMDSLVGLLDYDNIITII